MKKIFILGLSCFLFAACGKKPEPTDNTQYLGKTIDVKSPNVVYNDCITGALQNIELYHKHSSSEVLEMCRKRADKVKELLEARHKYN